MPGSLLSMELAKPSMSDRGVFGLDVLVTPQTATVDIVFVHGLTGNRENTWKHQGSGTFWPKDLLAQDVVSARIMTYGYDADVFQLFGTTSTNTLRDHGKDLAETLSMNRRMAGCTDRPVIFVAHSLGGLVCQKALLISRNATEAWENKLFETTRAIAFLGTPHHGSEATKMFSALKLCVSAVTTVNDNIVNVLKPSSEILADLQQEFHIMIETRKERRLSRPAIFCFFEELQLIRPKRVGHVVPQHSAILAQYGNQGIHANHIEICKFKSLEDPGYVKVSCRIRSWIMDMDEEIKQAEDAKQAEDRVFRESLNLPQVVFQGSQRAGRDINNTVHSR
ncbi:hypothetical protein CcaCcLH18_09047 [Colletotrichum camelliae]|nr:hypothetical protein CcaCcLH18_09047 [Colletotrichum camelliae]